MRVGQRSLYAAFGNKESLFRQALDLYEREKLAYVENALAAPTARGCLGVLTSMQLSDEAQGIRKELAARSALGTEAFVARFARAKAEGDLSQTADPLGLARMLLAVTHGLIVQSSLGASAVELHAIVNSSLALWPSL